MDRRVPIGMSLRGCGTMTVRPAAFRYFAWLPRLETKEKPSAERMLMKAEEERRFAIGRSGDGKSDTKSEDQSVSKLVAKLAKISREDPAAALAQIDSILRAESKSSSDRDTDTSRHLSRIVVQEEKKENDDV